MLQVLMVGCGNIAGGFDAARDSSSAPLTHAGAFRAAGCFALQACVDPDDARREAFMRHWNVRHGFRSLGDLAGAGLHFDMASICSPTARHAHDVEQVLQLGVRLLFCEKPMAPTVTKAKQIITLCERAGTLLAVNHNRRWDPTVTKLAREMAEGDWGALRSASGLYNKGIVNNGTHLFDLLHLLVGPLRLRHAGRPCQDHWTNDPSVPLLLETQHDIPVAINCAHAADYAAFELQLVFERGIIAMEDGGLRWRARRAVPSSEFAGYQALGADTRLEGGYLQCMLNAVHNIRTALEHGDALASTGHTALQAQLLAEQALAASASIREQ